MLRAVALLLALGGWDCETVRGHDLRIATNQIGGDAICSYAASDNYEITCVGSGRRYSCLVAGERANCALTSLTPAEGR